MNSSTQKSPFRINGALSFIPKNGVGKRIESLIEQAFSLSQLDKLYRQVEGNCQPHNFLEQTLNIFNVEYDIKDAHIARIPKTGPAVIVANHPFGAIEGIILAHLLLKVRPDVKIMANFVLKRIPEVSDLFISVNPFGGSTATKNNTTPMKEAIRWLKQDGLLVVFPAGEVSHFNTKKRLVIDPEWNSNIAKLISKVECPTQCMHFDGSNSLLFHIAGMIHPRLRTALLPRELINKSDRTIRIRAGHPIPYSQLQKVGDHQQQIDHLKLRTYMLRNTMDGLAANTNLTILPKPIIPAVEPACLKKEVDSIPEDNLLVDGPELQVFVSLAKETPNVLREIGRLREVTFRATGEGSNQEVDLDQYDQYYLHLFIWNKQKHELVGAYRLGQGDKIIEKYGIKGFYSRSLFKFPRKFVDMMPQPLELGRSFIRQEYQRSFAPLLLLWRGIATYVSRNPQYRWLFGPVSISNDYHHASQQMMVEFFRKQNGYPHLARLVKAQKGFKCKNLRIPQTGLHAFRDIDTLSGLVSEIEGDKKGIPILIKQYLKLGGQILDFNIDPKFNLALDGLIVVDLASTDTKVLGKYMGKQEAVIYQGLHSNIKKAG